MSETKNRLVIFAFCLFSLGGIIGICALLLPYATLSADDLKRSTEAADMETYDTFDLGEDFGELTIFDLIGHYLDNPPAEQTNDTVVKKKKHFGGC